MRSQLAVRLGVLEPQILRVPPDVVSLESAEEAIELAERYGVADGHGLDESQQLTLRAALGERADGTWAATTVADFEPRQNGKNDTVAARELAGLLLFGERLLLHTAHEFKTANESFLRMVAVFEAWDDLRRDVARIRWANGEQGIEFRDGRRLKYLARSGGSGRGYAKVDLTVYDEAQHLKAEHLAASAPTKLANPNAQTWFCGSGGLSSSRTAWQQRRRALAGEDGRYAYVEHTAEQVSLEGRRVVSVRPDPLDREAWARANPAFGRRISDESMLDLFGLLGAEGFTRECLCVWDPEPGDEGWAAIDAAAWAACQVEGARLGSQLCVGFDVNSERSAAAIAMSDGAAVELVDFNPGVGWAVDRLAELSARWNAPIALDPGSPAGVFLRDLIDRQVPTVEVAGRAFQQACGSLYDAIVERSVAFRPSPYLTSAASGAATRPSGDAWVWSRRNSEVDVSPLVAATLARWGAFEGAVPPPDIF